MLRANARFCDSIMPDTGLVLHSRDQYAEPELAQFADSTVAIAAVATDSPAARQGVRAGDQIIAIGSIRVSNLERQGERPARDLAFDILADQPLQSPVRIEIIRDGEPVTVDIVTSPACKVLVEVTTESGFAARTDGKVMQVSYPLVSAVNDTQLAAVVAHELGHVVLRHRARLEAAGVDGGLLKEIGNNRLLGRTAEVEADRISVHLMANAGVDPQAAVEFWKTEAGKRVGGGLFRSAIYPSVEARAAMLADEIARYLPWGAAPDYPGHLLEERDNPM